MDLEFGNVMPTFHKIAYQEVKLPKVVKQAAHFKVLDWNFRNAGSSVSKSAGKPSRKIPDPAEFEALKDRLRVFLQFVVVNLISEADRAEIRVQEIDPGVLRFRLLVTQKDVKDMIGRNGATASAIRNLLKAAAQSHGVLVLLEVLSHEEELASTRPQ